MKFQSKCNNLAFLHLSHIASSVLLKLPDRSIVGYLSGFTHRYKNVVSLKMVTDEERVRAPLGVELQSSKVQIKIGLMAPKEQSMGLFWHSMKKISTAPHEKELTLCLKCTTEVKERRLG